jgi:hypothetical protein
VRAQLKFSQNDVEEWRRTVGNLQVEKASDQERIKELEEKLEQLDEN